MYIAIFRYMWKKHIKQYKKQTRKERQKTHNNNNIKRIK